MSSRAYSLLYFLLIFIHGNLFSNDLLDELSKQVDILSVEDAFMVSIDIYKNSVNNKNYEFN